MPRGVPNWKIGHPPSKTKGPSVTTRPPPRGGYQTLPRRDRVYTPYKKKGPPSPPPQPPIRKGQPPPTHKFNCANCKSENRVSVH